jgi:hypothetical protein
VLSVVPDDGSASPAPGPAAFTVGQLLGLLDDALRSAGLVELWVSGTVTGLRRWPKFTTLELVDYEADGSTVASVLTVGAFARHAREITATLAGAGTELADGLQVTVWGRLDLNPRYGRLRLLAERVDPRTRWAPRCWPATIRSDRSAHPDLRRQVAPDAGRPRRTRRVGD